MQKSFKAIPFQRKLLYLLSLPFIPMLYLGIDYTAKIQELKKIESYRVSLFEEKTTKEQKQSVNNNVKGFYAKGASDYLQKTLSPLKLLKKEREATEKLKEKIAIPTSETFENRYQFLIGGENTIEFVGSDHQLQEGVQETLFKLTRTVEVDAKDLQDILMLIEKNQADQPQLIVTDFILNKKITANQTEVYELNMQLLQREFIP